MERRKKKTNLIHDQSGWKRKDISEAMDVIEGSVSHWIKRGHQGGEKV